MAKPGPDQAFWIAVDNQLWLLTPDETPDFSNPDWVLDAKIASIETDRFDGRR